MSAEFWLNLQRIHDLDAARASVDASAVERLATATAAEAEGGAAL